MASSTTSTSTEAEKKTTADDAAFTEQDWIERQKTQGAKSALDLPEDDNIWQILYWPATDSTGKVFAGAGRAEYLRVIFEEAGVPYEEVSNNIVEYFWKKAEELQPFPVLSPPAIRKGEFVLCQTAVCAKHLGIVFGMYPKELQDQSHADQIVTTVHEYIAEGRMAFHPVKNSMSYHDQVEEAKPYIKAFKEERLPRYMMNIERYLKANKSNSGFFVGDSLTYVDLQVMVMLQVTKSQWPDVWENRSLEMATLKSFLDRMESRPRIKTYLESPRKRPFAGDSLM